MSQPRLAPLDPPYPPAVEPQFAALQARGLPLLKLFRTIAHNPRVLQRFFASSLLDQGSLSLAERELVILRSCARCGSEYEWGVHVQYFAERAGFSSAAVAASVHGGADDAVWSSDQRLLIRLVDGLHDDMPLSADLWRALAARWSREQLVELVVLAGYYHMVAFVTTAFAVELEDGAARFPEAVAG
jgi:4-carboxymuconolactone decarboxylase